MKEPHEVRSMISVQEAKKIIASTTGIGTPVMTSLIQAYGKVLAADVLAPVAMPAFHQSVMDGYAIRYEGWQTYGSLLIAGEAAAGANSLAPLLPQQAMRIFTGAPIPPEADTVVMQEKVRVQDGWLEILDDELRVGSNVRLAGSEIEAGSTAVVAGAKVNAGTIGFLAGLGVSEVMIRPAPVVAIIVTGNELHTPGSSLPSGKVYESNSFALRAAMLEQHVKEVTVVAVKDDLPALTLVLQQALESSDFVLLTGGVSVGDYDFVPRAAEAADVLPHFHKLKQKPGKPLYYGKKDEKFVFGLPGNPSSVLTCFYEYVYPCIRRWMGYQSHLLPAITLPLHTSHVKKEGLTHFLKGRLEDNGGVTILPAQESWRMSAFAQCNCLVVLPEEGTVFLKDDMVEVHLLPG